MSDWRAAMQRSQAPVVVDCGPPASDEDEDSGVLSLIEIDALLQYVRAQEPADAIMQRALMDGIGPHIRRRIVGGERMIFVVHVPDLNWAHRSTYAFENIMRAIAAEAGRDVLTTTELLTPERHRREIEFSVDTAIGRHKRAHVVVSVLPKQSDAIGLQDLRDIADAELHFSPADAIDVIEQVVGERHPGFEWHESMDAHRLTPDHLRFAVHKAANGKQAASLLWRLLQSQTAAEREATQAAATEMYEEAEAKAKAKSKRTKSGVEILSPTTPSLTELAGYGRCKTWAMETIVDILAYRDKKIVWADVDSGCLLAGMPGTGKTLFATAFAAAAGMKLIVTSYADWQSSNEGHLGHLLRRMKAVFEAANEAAAEGPVVLFIDEVDAIASRNLVGRNGQRDDWWPAVVGALLELLDGSNRREGVIVIAACNDPSKLDPALLRSGRLDRRFDLELPDEEALVGIFAHHLPGVASEAFEPAATALAGSISGADVARFAREARRIARRAEREMTAEDVMAIAIPEDVRPAELQMIAAVHEAGHVVVGAAGGRIAKAMTIVGTAFAHGGVRFGTDVSTGRLAEYESYVVTLLAGRAAEEVILGEPGAGAGGAEGSDLHTATALIGRMLGEHALGEKIAVHRVPSSVVEGEMQRHYARAIELVRQHRGVIEALARLVLKRRALSEKAIQAFLAEHGLAGL